MSMASKSFKELKEEALAHWQENLERIRTMDWDEWIHVSYDERNLTVLRKHKAGYPFIGGRQCAFCNYFSDPGCVHETPALCSRRIKGLECPLKQDDDQCCSEWLDVREALCDSCEKERAIEAAQVMINRIEEIPDDYGTKG